MAEKTETALTTTWWSDMMAVSSERGALTCGASILAPWIEI